MPYPIVSLKEAYLVLNITVIPSTYVNNQAVMSIETWFVIAAAFTSDSSSSYSPIPKFPGNL